MRAFCYAPQRGYTPATPSDAATGLSAPSCSPRCTYTPAPPRCRTAAALPHGRAATAGFCSVSSAAAAVGDRRSSSTTSATSAAGAAGAAGSPAPSSSSFASLRFKSGRHRMTALERAAAAAHDALAQSRPTLATAAAARSSLLPLSLLGTGGGRPSSVAAGAVRSGARPSAPAPPPPSMEEDELATPEEREAEERGRRFVGQLQAVPHVLGAAEHLSSARKRTAKVTAMAGIRNVVDKERNRTTRRLDLLMKELSVPLGRYVAGFPQPGRLHPFEAALLALTVGEGAYVAALQRVDKLRKAVQEVGKGAAGRAANAPNKAAAVAAHEEGVAAIEEVFSSGARHVDALKEVAKALRSLPSLDTSLPTLALVGAPNVGKSSLVNILSSGTPEVCNYPFTTRSIKMGHFYLDAQKHQVTDTPGLLRRPDTERNRMEALTLAALGCLDTAVLFVVDLTEECGTSVDDQWAIRSELRARFPDKAWIDVLSKADMLEDTFEVADELARERVAGSAGAQGPSESAGEGKGVVEVVTPVEVAARLRGALRISSLTHDGIPQLQLEIIHTLRAQAAAREQVAAQEQAQRREAAAEQGPELTPAQQQQLDRLRQLQQAAQGGAGGSGGAGGKAPVLTLFS